MKTILAALLSATVTATTVLAPVAAGAASARPAVDYQQAKELERQIGLTLLVLDAGSSTPAQRDAATAWLVAHRAEAQAAAASLVHQARTHRILSGLAALAAVPCLLGTAAFAPAGVATAALVMTSGWQLAEGNSFAKVAQRLVSDVATIGSLGSNVARDTSTRGAVVAAAAPADSADAHPPACTGFHH